MNGFTEKQKSLILVNYNQLFRMFTTSKCNPKGEKIYVPYVGKNLEDNHLIRDTVICQTDYSMSRTSMVFQSLDDICYEFDLGKPIWLSIPISMTLSAMPKHALQKIALLNKLILIIWKLK